MKRISKRKKNIIKQRLAGLAFMLISILPLIIFKGETIDGGYLFVTAPIGCIMLFSRTCYWIG